MPPVVLKPARRLLCAACAEIAPYYLSSSPQVILIPLKKKKASNQRPAKKPKSHTLEFALKKLPADCPAGTPVASLEILSVIAGVNYRQFPPHVNPNCPHAD